jgi:hypothetical protein
MISFNLVVNSHLKNEKLVQNILNSFNAMPSIWNRKMLAYFNLKCNINVDILEKNTAVEHLIFLGEATIITLYCDDVIISDDLMVYNMNIQDDLSTENIIELAKKLHQNHTLYAIIREPNDLKIVFPMKVNNIDYVCVLKKGEYNLVPLFKMDLQIGVYLDTYHIELKVQKEKYALILQRAKHIFGTCNIEMNKDDYMPSVFAILQLNDDNTIKRSIYYQIGCCNKIA